MSILSRRKMVTKKQIKQKINERIDEYQNYLDTQTDEELYVQGQIDAFKQVREWIEKNFITPF